MGLFSAGADSAIDSLKKAAVEAGCSAVRGSVGDVIHKYNYAIRNTNGMVDVNGKTNQFIDTSIANTSRQVLDGYAMNWRTPTSKSATGGSQVPNTPVVLPNFPQVAPSTAKPASSPAQAPSGSGSSGLGAAIFR